MKLTKDERTAAEALLKILQAALEAPDAQDDKQEKPAKATKQDAGAVNLEEYDEHELREAAKRLRAAGKIDVSPQGIGRRGRDKLLELFKGVRQKALREAFGA